MDGYWERTDPDARLTDRNQVLAARAVDPAEAQTHVNFVVFDADEPPPGHAPAEHSLRPEQPPGRPDGIAPKEIAQTPWSEGNPTSLRTVWRAGDRALRMKQFLYDWAPPAAGVAPIWDTPSFESHPCQDTAAFVGTDYRSQRGACAQLERTQVELSVLDGEYSADELVAVLRSLRPANQPTAEAARHAPFHRLNYWVRYRVPPYRVPYGLWRYPVRRPYEDPAAVVSSTCPTDMGLPLPPDTSHFEVDSTFALEDNVEVRWRHEEVRSEHLVLIATRRTADDGLPIPPDPESQAAELREAREVRGGTGWVAALDRRHGAWECWWSEGDWNLALYTSPSLRWDEPSFLTFVESLRTE